MRQVSLLLLMAVLMCAQDGQKESRSGWPCVSGRAVDPAYIETSESTGGQVFLFQKDEIAQSTPALMASTTHPATILRGIGNVSGAREFQFNVDSAYAWISRNPALGNYAYRAKDYLCSP